LIRRRLPPLPPDDSTINVLYQIAGAQKRYTVEFDKDAKGTIYFGDGISGLIPPSTAILNVKYRIGGGTAGNLRRGSIRGNVRGYLPSGAGLNVRVYNHENARGGNPEESLSQTKLLAPAKARSCGRAVTQRDWTTLAMSYRDPVYGSPSFAVAQLKQRIPESNAVQVIVWSRDAGGRISAPSTPLKQGIKSYLDALRTFATYVEVLDGEVLYFDLAADVVLKEGRTVSTILDTVTADLQNYFNSAFVIPGTDLVLSLINKVIQDNEFVEASTLTSVQGSTLEEISFGNGDGIITEFQEYFDILIRLLKSCIDNFERRTPSAITIINSVPQVCELPKPLWVQTMLCSNSLPI